jgi:hypothetical protein
MQIIIELDETIVDNGASAFALVLEGIKKMQNAIHDHPYPDEILKARMRSASINVEQHTEQICI